MNENNITICRIIVFLIYTVFNRTFCYSKHQGKNTPDLMSGLNFICIQTEIDTTSSSHYMNKILWGELAILNAEPQFHDCQVAS